MHIPDGFLGPQTWLPAYGVAGAGWAWALRGLRRDLRAETAPRLGVVAGCSFVLMLVAIPLPGGTSCSSVSARDIWPSRWSSCSRP